MQFKETTERIIGCFYEVYNELGPGYLESIYQNALGIAFRDIGLAYAREFPLQVRFRNENVGEFRADFVVEQAIVIELKAIPELLSAHEAQLINYLKATGLNVGLLLNFGTKAQVKRRVFGPLNPPSSV
ncbi:MAG: GxxExxY protein [Betaproteobacteria bacterium]